MNKYFVVGGAGFIGSHMVDRLMNFWTTQSVTIYDNFSSGQEWHYKHHLKDRRLKVIRADAKDFTTLVGAMAGHNVVIHLAANADISKSETNPSVDFNEGTLLTHNILEAMRQNEIKNLLYSSSSAVYGDLGEKVADENYSPLCPISTYGASKLASEALISSYCHMFGFKANLFRFGNVVGHRQTHGVGFEFLKQLLEHPQRLHILGDGTQSKPYIYVTDVVNGILCGFLNSTESFSVYNLATNDHTTVSEIANLAIECLGLDKNNVKLSFAGGKRGWKGDIPVVRMDSNRITQLGWKCNLTSQEAVKKSLLQMIPNLKHQLGGKLDSFWNAKG